jgi:hypothetical protein
VVKTSTSSADYPLIQSEDGIRSASVQDVDVLLVMAAINVRALNLTLFLLCSQTC